MNKTFLISVCSLLSFTSLAQNSCIKHWTQDSMENHQLDTLFSKISFENIDSTFCKYEEVNGFDPKWQIDFYNKQIGKYFSDARSINFIKFYSQEKDDKFFNEIHIIQFDLPEKDLKKFKNKYGIKINGYGFFNINVFTLYRYLVKDNSVYFISTESYEKGNPKTAYFFDKIFQTFLGSKGQDTAILKRTPYTLKIDVDKVNFYEDEIGATPYVFPNNGMQIYPGETIYVEVEQGNGIITSMKAVKEIKNPATTLTIKFSQQSENKIHQMMMLEIKNPFPQNLVYNATMFLLKQNKWVDTNVYPVMAGLSAFETWPDVIISLGLGSWKFSDK